MLSNQTASRFANYIMCVICSVPLAAAILALRLTHDFIISIH